MSLSENTSENNMLEDGVEGINVPPVFDTEIEPSDEAVTEEPEEIRIPPVFNMEAESADVAAEESADGEPEEEEVLLPPEPEESRPFYGSADNLNLTWWGFSQQGESHLKNELPCQDRCTVLLSEGERPVIIAAIADGVGSCALSHYGASIAVNTSAAFLKEAFDQHQGELEDQWVGDHLREAMALAQESVAKAAADMEQLEYSFQSTLTIGVYEGNTGTLYIGHIGDDGVVVVEGQNTELVTTRHKGEEASSVYPLQSGPAYWQVMKVDRCVSGFILATDGVLDAFVRPEREHNRVYYPFIQPAFETRQETEELLKETVDFYNDYMSGASYRSTVTDDLTMVAVTNQKLLVENGVPVFDSAAWAAETEEYQRKAYEALYPDKKAKENEADAPDSFDAPEASAQQEEPAVQTVVETEAEIGQDPEEVSEESGSAEPERKSAAGESLAEPEHEENVEGNEEAEQEAAQETEAESISAEASAPKTSAEEISEPSGTETDEDEKADETDEPDTAEEANTINKILPLLLIFGGALALAAILKTLP